jgi:hypothetical protein
MQLMTPLRLASVLLVLVGLGSAAATAPARPLQAEPYLQLVGTIPITGQATVFRGEEVTAYGSAFCGAPGCSAVTIRIGDRIAARGVDVSPNGTFRAAVRVSEMPGQYLVTASQQGPGASMLSDAAPLVVAIGDAAEEGGPEVTLRILSVPDRLFAVTVHSKRSYAGKAVYMQRRTAARRWRIVKKVRLGSRSTKRFTAPLPRGVSRVRIFVPRVGPGTRAGYSRVRTVRR